MKFVLVLLQKCFHFLLFSVCGNDTDDNVCKIEHYLRIDVFRTLQRIRMVRRPYSTAKYIWHGITPECVKRWRGGIEER